MMPETEWDRFKRQRAIVDSPTGKKFADKLWPIVTRNNHSAGCYSSKTNKREDCKCHIIMQFEEILEVWAEAMLQEGYETMAEKREERQP